MSLQWYRDISTCSLDVVWTSKIQSPDSNPRPPATFCVYDLFPTPLQSTQILYNGLSLISVCLFELTVKVNINDRNVYFIGRNSKYEKLTCPICCFANNLNIDARPFNSRYGGLLVCIANLVLCQWMKETRNSSETSKHVRRSKQLSKHSFRLYSTSLFLTSTCMLVHCEGDTQYYMSESIKKSRYHMLCKVNRIQQRRKITSMISRSGKLSTFYCKTF